MAYKNQLKTVERKGWGGTYFDSLSHAAMFRKYAPQDFGIKTAQLFSAKLGTHLLNKKFTYMTVAKGNVHVLTPGVDDYQWKLVASADLDFRITENLLGANTTPGQGGEEFEIAIDRPFVQEPMLLKTESANAPFLRVIGQSRQRSMNSWAVTVKLQTSDNSVWIDPAYLAPGRTLIDGGTSVSDELNQKFAGLQFGEMFKLQSWTSNYARKAEFTDKFIRMEIGCRREGRSMTGGSYAVGGKEYSDGAIGVGYTYEQPFRNLNGTDGNGSDKVYADVFVSKVEARLFERIERDREFNMEWGQLEKDVDAQTNRVTKVAPGWRQLVRDGHYKEHNGSLTLSDLYEYIAEIFVTRRDFADRKIIIAAGEGASEYLHRLIASEASQFQLVDSHFVRSVPSMFNENALEYGAQFTSVRLPNGYVMQIVHDPIKDDRQLFPEKAPGTNRTLESYAMDFYDFGATDQKAIDATREENITMVMQGGVEAYWTVSNVYDFETGAITDGSNARSNNKELGIYREMSGSLGIWDISRCGRLEFNPVA